MTKATHTPGPWGYEDPMGPDILTIVANPDAPVYEWIWVAQIGTEPVEDEDGTVRDKRSFAEHEANARLIAAAPDMLAALMELVRIGDLPVKISIRNAALDKARAAIARAEGSQP